MFDGELVSLYVAKVAFMNERLFDVLLYTSRFSEADYKCDQDGCHGRSIKTKQLLKKCPDILILHLNRIGVGELVGRLCTRQESNEEACNRIDQFGEIRGNVRPIYHSFICHHPYHYSFIMYC